MVWAERHVGITYGGAEGSGEPPAGTLHANINGHTDLSEQASSELGGYADATWGDRNMSDRNRAHFEEYGCPIEEYKAANFGERLTLLSISK